MSDKETTFGLWRKDDAGEWQHVGDVRGERVAEDAILVRAEDKHLVQKGDALVENLDRKS